MNLVCGPLGVGKTTAIRHLLENRPEGERWAVLVNEYGLVGLDAALLADDRPSAGVEIREVAGGCICCSAGFLFETSLAMLLQRRPDRLLIEPTGLAALSGILDSLDRPAVREHVDVRSTICLLDPATAAPDRQRDEVADQIEAADVLAANRCDLASAEDIEAFSVWAETLFPRKRQVVLLERGRIDVALLDLVADRRVAAPRGDCSHGTDHHHAPHDDVGGGRTVLATGDAPQCDESRPIVRREHLSPILSTVGWVCWRGLVFDAERAVRFLAQLSRLPGAQRTKAVLRTEDGWWSFNFTSGDREAQPAAYRRDSRVEVVIRGGEVPDLDTLDEVLEQALVPAEVREGA